MRCVDILSRPSAKASSKVDDCIFFFLRLSDKCSNGQSGSRLVFGKTSAKVVRGIHKGEEQKEVSRFRSLGTV